MGGWVLAVVVAAIVVAVAVLVVTDDRGGTHVAAVGDSVTYLSAGVLQERFDWADRFDVQARPGFRTDQLVPVAEDLLADGPDALVLLTGYNDILQLADPEAGLQLMVEVATRAPCAVWMLVPVKGDYDRASMEAYNTRLEELTRPVSTIHLSPAWRDVVDAPEGPDPSSDLISTDRVHPTDAGSRILAEAMEAAVRRECLPS
ncbi:MAG TPA: SGNH/GDSL hydrolase family protein [Acidimicrobiales bacterium]|nr:SGNH/GDSL hydrolase family protein [Acidimicrobiales bacterium]